MLMKDQVYCSNFSNVTCFYTIVLCILQFEDGLQVLA